jgi:hypothetical protein
VTQPAERQRATTQRPNIDFDRNPMKLEIVADIPEDTGEPGMTETETSDFLTRPYVEGSRQ